MSTRQSAPNELGIKILLGMLWVIGTTWLFRGELKLWDSGGALLFPFIYWKRLVAIATGVILAKVILTKRAPRCSYSFLGLIGILVIFCSDWLYSPYALFRAPSIRGEVILCCLIMWAIILAGIAKGFIKALGICSCLGLFATILTATHGNLIFSDDHPVFLQRLVLLKENFPWIPFYNPRWNLGIDQRDFFATGALGVFLVLSPILYLVDISQNYTSIVALLLFCVIPLGTAYATYRLTRSWTATAIAIVLLLGNSLVWYRWALKYGTIGFLFSSSLIPLAISLLDNYLDREKAYSIGQGALLTAILTLMLLWSPTGLALIPIGALGLLSLPLILRDRPRRWTLCAIMAINLAWISIFLSVSRVSNYVSTETSSKRKIVAHRVDAETSATEIPLLAHTAGVSLKVLRDWANSEHPLILMMCIPALLTLARRQRIFSGTVAIWCLGLGTIGSLYLPHLELDRMLLIAGLVSIPAIARLLEQIVENAQRGRMVQQFSGAIVSGILLATPFCISSVLLNRSVEHYEVARPVVSQLSEAIRLFGGDGRTTFAGFILHELNGGHIAPLTLWSGKQINASSHVHDKWTYTSVFPERFASRGKEGIREYLDLTNSTSVVAHETKWIQFFRSQPQEYEERWRHEHFALFGRKNVTSSYFHEGEGKISKVTSNAVIVIPETQEATLRYQYFPFLQADTCSIKAHEVSGINFIRLTGCTPGKDVTINAKTLWHRVTW